MPNDLPGRNLLNLQTIRWRYIIMNTLVIILGLIATVSWTTKKIQIEANTTAVEKAKSDLRLAEALLDSRLPGPWTLRDNKLYKGETQIDIDGNNDFVDEIGVLTGDTCTIFQGSTRVSTNVIRDNMRVLGNQVSEEVERVVLGRSILRRG